MTTISHRTVFADFSSGVMRMPDFCRVRTNLGPMIEPCMTLFPRGLRSSGDRQDFDATDECLRVDAIEYVDQGKWNIALSGGEDAGIWMGGTSNRVGN